MAKINLSPYTIRIKRKYSAKDEDISDLFGTKISLYDVISNISLKFKQRPYKQSKNQKALKFENKIKTNSNNRVKILQDIIFYGEYGRILKLMDTDTGIMDKNQIDPNKSPVLDFTITYFEDSLIKTQSYIIAQTYSNNGYKTIFHNLLKEEINDRFGIDSTVEINPIISSEIIDLIKRGGRIFDITLISHDISKDSTDHLLSDSSKNCLIIGNTNEISFSLSSSRGANLINIDKIEDFVDSLKKMILNSAETPFYEITKSRLDEIKIKIKTKNKEHTVGISSDDLEFKEIRPLDDEDVILKNGTIAINYILKEARDYSTEIVDMYKQVS